jgi:hypothetical protein
VKREKANEVRSLRYKLCDDCGEEHEFPARRGGFFRDGRFNPDSDMGSPFERWLEVLVMRRRREQISPAAIGEVVLISEFRDAFDLKILEQWLAEPDWEMWACMHAVRACEQYVLQAGYGSHVPGVWRGGSWIPRHMAQPEPMATPEQVAEIMAKIETKP